MRIAIMQPYFFPYIGYFELMKAVDVFVFLTTVQYIRRGWVNRNRIRTQDGWRYITVPVQHQPRETLICDTLIDHNQEWLLKMLNTLESTYKKAAQHPLFESLARERSLLLSPMLIRTLKATASYLKITPEFIESWKVDKKGQAMILSICRTLGATTYVNLSGGRELYDESVFQDHGIAIQTRHTVPCHPTEIGRAHV